LTIKSFSFRIEYHAWLGGKFVYWMRYMDAQNENENPSVKKPWLLGKCGFIHGGNENWTFIVFSFWNKFLKTKVLHQQKSPSKADQGNDFGNECFVLESYHENIKNWANLHIKGFDRSFERRIKIGLRKKYQFTRVCRTMIFRMLNIDIFILTISLKTKMK
jgi:hypothetical protein